MGPPGGGGDIYEIFAKYCDIVSRGNDSSTKEFLFELSKSVNNNANMRDTVMSSIHKLKQYVDATEDSRRFTVFYNFVFFICRENGQRSITIQRAIPAWRIVLNGKFLLLDQWCSYVEKNHRFNISEDTWQQLLAFSMCVNEDLEGYDPLAAWPFLIDEFVEHMRSVSQFYNCCTTNDEVCYCGDMDSQLSISNTFRGLNLFSGSKRKATVDVLTEDMEIYTDDKEPTHLEPSKRQKGTYSAVSLGPPEPDIGTLLLVNGAQSCLPLGCRIPYSQRSGAALS